MVARAAYPAERKAGAASQRAIRAEFAAEYAEPHTRPWAAGFSGGKDSAVVAHPVVKHPLSLPRSDRHRRCAVADNDHSPHGCNEFIPFPDFRGWFVPNHGRPHRTIVAASQRYTQPRSSSTSLPRSDKAAGGATETRRYTR